jgi:hypothetical protein
LSVATGIPPQYLLDDSLPDGLLESMIVAFNRMQQEGG